MAYKLDPSAKPKAIDLNNGGGKTFDCVYTLDGDTLTIAAPMTPGGDRPKEVGSKEGSQTRVLVLKRDGKEGRWDHRGHNALGHGPEIVPELTGAEPTPTRSD